MAKKSAYKELKGSWSKFVWQSEPFDYISYRLRWKYAPVFQFVTPFPTHLDIEATNTCDLRCCMCPHSNPTKEFKASLGFMDYLMYETIINEGRQHGLKSIKLNWRGEPLLHSKLPQMIKYAKKKDVVEVAINTNGTQLDEQKALDLISAKLDYIIFSVDAYTKETYEKIRVGADFDQVHDNIRQFIAIRNSMKKRKPLVRMQLVKMDSNKHEIDDYYDYWKGKVDIISVQDYTNRGEGKNKLTSAEKYDGRLPCPQIWQRMVITWDGKAIMCCRDWESENIIGNIADNTIKELWHSEMLNMIREMHKEKKLDKIPICKKCTLKETYNWVS